MPVHNRIVFVPAVLVLAILACSVASPTVSTPAPEPALPGSQAAQAPSPEPVHAPATANVPPTVAVGGLSHGDGPWIVFADEGGIWGLNEDGTGLTNLSETPPDWGGIVPSPSGDLFAYVTSWSDEAASPKLHVFSMVTRTDLATIGLSAASTGADLQDGEKTAADEALLASLTSEPAWSPDGGSLAFVGAIDGDTADVYTYSVATGVVTQLTSGPSQAGAPSWSPDGKYVVHFGRETFPDVSGNYEILGMWAARADGSKASAVENVSFGVGSWIPGWDQSDPSRFFLTSWDSDCWGKDLQLVDLETGKVLRIWEGGVRDAKVSPRGGGLILMGARSCTDPAQVIRVLPDLELRVEAVGTPDAVAWLDDTTAGDTPQAVAHTDWGWYLFPVGGEATQLSAPPGRVGLAGLAPGTDTLLWTGDGLWTGKLDDPSAAPVQVFDRPVDWVIASQGAAHLVFFSGGEIWAASASSGYQPVQVGEAVGLMIGWPVRVE